MFRMYQIVWLSFCRKPKNCIIFTISVISTIGMLSILARFICWVETRPGLTFDDPILTKFNPVDVTWIIFSALYFSVFWTLISLLKKPEQLTQSLISYTLILFFRMLAMYLLPLEAPKTIIPLQDPLIEYFGTGVTLTKDLFFSGHTALMFLLYLSASYKLQKLLMLLCTIIVSSGVLAQHVHYSVDVLVAFIVTYSCWNFSRGFCKRFLVK